MKVRAINELNRRIGVRMMSGNWIRDIFDNDHDWGNPLSYMNIPI
jgi:hypothetical protein